MSFQYQFTQERNAFSSHKEQWSSILKGAIVSKAMTPSTPAYADATTIFPLLSTSSEGLDKRLRVHSENEGLTRGYETYFFNMLLT